MRVLYSIAIEIAVWLVLVPLALLRIAAGRSTLQTLAERLGVFHAESAASDRRLVIHAVSAGEMNAASSIVHELSARGWSFVISAGNEDARRTALRIRQHHASVEKVVAWPWDRRGAVSRWLSAIRPDAVVVVETEIWPNLFFACRERGIPLIVAGGRIDPDAARWYRRLRFFFGGVLAAADAILTVDAAEREQYLAIGAARDHVGVGGNLKAGACLIAHESSTRVARPRKMVVGASTHRSEEEIILSACRSLSPLCGAIDLVLVPRHVRRAAAVRRVVNQRWPDGDVEVVDRMGALSGIYAMADVAIVGGTFVDIGGHDVFEPARAGCAIIAGPHVDRIRETLDAMIEANAVRITTTAKLGETIAALLMDDAERSRLATNARSFADSRGGAAGVCADRIEELVARAKATYRA
jgi:3-deoxy-D-manno-octulosonic-acid transferase